MNAKVITGDIIYIYLTAPIKQIGFRCEVLGTGFDLDTIRDQVSPFIKGEAIQEPGSKPFMKLGSTRAVPIQSDAALTLSKLREHGLNGMLMGARKLENNPGLFEFIKKEIR